MFKFSKKIIIILTLSLFVLGGILTYLYYPKFDNVKFIQNIFKKGFTVENNNQVIDPFDEVDKPGRFDNIWANWVNIDPLNPIITYVTFKKVSGGTDEFNYIQFSLKKNFANYSVKKLIYAFPDPKKLSQEKILEFSKIDFDKENPDPENIKVQTPPSKAEVEDSKKRAEERKKEDKISEEKDYWNTYIKPSNSENKTEKKEFIEKYLKTLIEFKARREQDPAGEIEFYKIKCTPERAKTTDFKMCDFDDGIKLANQYLKELEEKK